MGVYTLTMGTDLTNIPKECVAYNFLKTARHLSSFYRKIISPSGLKGNQFPLLLAIKLQEPVPISLLAHSLELERTTLSRNLKRLQANGYIVMESDEDQRVRNVQLSGHGTETLEAALPLWQEAQETIVQQFGEDNWRQMLRSMKELEKIVG